MEPKKFGFWQGHSLHYLEMAFRNDRRKRVVHPDGYGKRTGECGDTVEMYLSIRKGCIRSVSYETNGCMDTNACADLPAAGSAPEWMSEKAISIGHYFVASAFALTPAGSFLAYFQQE